MLGLHCTAGVVAAAAAAAEHWCLHACTTVPEAACCAASPAVRAVHSDVNIGSALNKRNLNVAGTATLGKAVAAGVLNANSGIGEGAAVGGS